MPGHSSVLVVSSDSEDRKALAQLLDRFSLHVIPCSSVAQASEVLSRHAVDVAFCDDRLSDGCYRDLLAIKNPGQKLPRLVVIFRTGEWEQYLEAMHLGAFDALRRPWRPTDVEVVILRATQDDRRAADRRIA